LAPPLLARVDPRTGRPEKKSFGPWIFPVFRLLAAMKGLRGTAFDPFGRTSERKLERQLIADFENDVACILRKLTPANHAVAVELAAAPLAMRGFGPVKLANVETVRRRLPALRAGLDGVQTPSADAAQ
jgi:indolepyruvate ferredoxin oxidoreductase